MLELKHLSYAVHEDGGELGILNDIALTVGDGRLVVFTGPNGGGGKPPWRKASWVW